ncbi:MAG: NADH-quinone oxidoreductase subunit NuoE [Rhodobacterales bacterium]
MLRRLHADQPAAFAFSPANQAWAEVQMTKFPEGRQASAIIPLLWRAQEQEGWLTRPAIERVADMLGMAYMRALEVASFYFMFQLQPVGSVAHVQVCGTTTCMICGAEDLAALCKEKIAPQPHQLSPDGKFSWEEVECLGACTNAPMAQIGKDYYEDLTVARLGDILDQMAAGHTPGPGPQNGRIAAEPRSGLSALKIARSSCETQNASVDLATALGDTLQRIQGTETDLRTPRLDRSDKFLSGFDLEIAPESVSVGVVARKLSKGGPAWRDAARDAGPDALTRIKGVGPKLQERLFAMGIFHLDQIADWTGAETAWIDDNIVGFKGRASRDNWVEQATALSKATARNAK